MPDFLTRVASRTMGLTPTAEPVVAPLFAPDPHDEVPNAAPDMAFMPFDQATEYDNPQPLPVRPPDASVGRTPDAPQPVDAPSDNAVPEPTAPQPDDTGRPNPRTPVPLGTIETVRDTTPGDGDAPLLPRPSPSARLERPALSPRSADHGGRPETAADALLMPPLTSPEAPSSPAGDAPAVTIVAPDITPADAVAPARRDARATREQAVAPPAPPPTIEITIGRVEVRAVAAPPAPPARPRPVQPGLSLEEYLRKQNGGRR